MTGSPNSPMIIIKMSDRQRMIIRCKVSFLTVRILREGGDTMLLVDPGSQFGRVRGQSKTSWITYPEDGRIPFSRQGNDLRSAAYARRGNDGPEVGLLENAALSDSVPPASAHEQCALQQYVSIRSD